MFMLSPIKNSTLGLYRCSKASSRFFINWLKSPVSVLYKLNIVNLDDLMSSTVAQISKSFSLELREILISLKYVCVCVCVCVCACVRARAHARESERESLNSLVKWRARVGTPTNMQLSYNVGNS